MTDSKCIEGSLLDKFMMSDLTLWVALLEMINLNCLLVSVTLSHLVTFRIQQGDVGTTSLNIFSDVYIASDFFVNLCVKKRKEKTTGIDLNKVNRYQLSFKCLIFIEGVKTSCSFLNVPAFLFLIYFYTAHFYLNNL